MFFKYLCKFAPIHLLLAFGTNLIELRPNKHQLIANKNDASKTSQRFEIRKKFELSNAQTFKLTQHFLG